MMDAFASIISNNLNIVMKFLTSVTIILAIPTMVASFWGMNVEVPMAGGHYAFLGILLFSLVLAGIIAVILARKRTVLVLYFILSYCNNLIKNWA